MGQEQWELTKRLRRTTRYQNGRLKAQVRREKRKKEVGIGR